LGRFCPICCCAIQARVVGFTIPKEQYKLATKLFNGLPIPLLPGDRVAVYPVFESLDIVAVSRVRPEPLRQPRFIADVHLGKLARWLCLLGFDTSYRNDFADADIVRAAHAEKRIILTRDLGILKQKAVTHGYWVRSSTPRQQSLEVLQRFDLFRKITPFSRCLEYNGEVFGIGLEEARRLAPAAVAAAYDTFFTYRSCRRLFWRGSHYLRLTARLRDIGGTGMEGKAGDDRLPLRPPRDCPDAICS